MPESKKGIYQIGINSFLFYNTPEIFYNISLEETEESQIKIIIVKILENNTNIFDTVVDFSEFGTGDNSSKDTIKNIDFIIFNHNFVIKEEENKINILFNTKNPKNIELFLHKLELEEEKDKDDLMYSQQMEQIIKNLEALKDTAAKQEQEIKQLQQNEDFNANKIKYLSTLTHNLITEIENKNSQNQYNDNNNNQYNNNSNNNNNNNNNQYYNNSNNQYNNNQYYNGSNNKYNNPYINNNNQINNNNEYNQYNNNYYKNENKNNSYNQYNNNYKQSNNNYIEKNPYNNNNNNNYNYDIYKTNYNNSNYGYNPYQ